MVIAFNNALLRVCLTDLVDFVDKLECCPSRIHQLMCEGLNGSSGSNTFGISTMELLFRDVHFRTIFTKVYLINSNFSINKKYSGYFDYYLIIRSSRNQINNFICERLQIKNCEIGEFISKFTSSFLSDYYARILLFSNLEIKMKKIKKK